MNHATEDPRPEDSNPEALSGSGEEIDSHQCAVRAWCDVPGPTHTGEHTGEADLPKVTATGDREEFVTADDGITVPEVIARLFEHTEPSCTIAPLSVALAIHAPSSGRAI